MQFSVYLKGQNILEKAPHRATRSFAKILLSADMAVLRGQNALQLTTSRAWKDVKSHFRTGSNLLNAPDYHVPAYTYPLSYEFLRPYERR